MTKSVKICIPEWAQGVEYQLFALRFAAAYYSPSGSIGELSAALGFSRTVLHMYLRRPSGLTANICIKLESLLGREMFPREFFRPDIFISAE